MSLWIVLFIILSGCSEPNSQASVKESVSDGSYPALLFVSGEERRSIGKTSEELQVEPGKLVGTVTTKYSIEITPKKELTSNYLEEGTEIYSVDGEPTMFLAKKKDGKYEVFE